MKKPLLIYGAGGLGREILSLVRASDEWEPAGFLDDSVPAGQVIKGVNVLGRGEVLSTFDGKRDIIIAIGDPILKHNIVQRLKPYGAHYPVVIHPSAILQDPLSIVLGEGCIVSAGCVLTTDLQINLNSTVGHDTHIGDCTSIMCGVNIAGEVRIGERVMIGSGANVLNRIAIYSQSRIGMGAAVVKDVAPDITVVGVPAKQMGE